MLKEGPSKPFLAALCIALAIALVSVLLAPPYSYPHAPQITSERQSEGSLKSQKTGNETPAPIEHRAGSSDEASEYWSVLGRRLKITDTLLVAFTFTLWWATRDLVREARVSSERQLRAYVSGRWNHIFAFNENIFARAKFTIENTGLTPAHNLTHHGDIIVAPHPLPTGYVFPPLTTTLSNPTVVFPRVNFDGDCTASKKFTSSEINSVIAGTSRIYAYSEIFYEDIFHEEDRKTCFAVSIEADIATLRKLTHNHPAPDLNVTMRITSVGNTAT